MWKPAAMQKGVKILNNQTVAPSLDHGLDQREISVPPTYTYSQAREPHVGPTFLASPDDQYNARLDNQAGVLGVSNYQDAPDPLRQSDFYAEGNKVRPWANMPKVSKIRLTEGKWSAENNTIGKLKQTHRVPTFEGTQLPSIQRYNIQEGSAQTYGSQYTVAPNGPPPPLVMANGMALDTNDGYPY